MTEGAKRIVIKVSAVIILGSAAIRWVKLFEEGFTIGGVFLLASLTVLGFWLFYGSRAKGSEDCCEPKE